MCDETETGCAPDCPGCKAQDRGAGLNHTVACPTNDPTWMEAHCQWCGEVVAGARSGDYLVVHRKCAADELAAYRGAVGVEGELRRELRELGRRIHAHTGRCSFCFDHERACPDCGPSLIEIPAEDLLP